MASLKNIPKPTKPRHLPTAPETNTNTRKGDPINWLWIECRTWYREDTQEFACTVRSKHMGGQWSVRNFPFTKISKFLLPKLSLAWWLKVTQSRKNGVSSRKPKFGHENKNKKQVTIFSRIVSLFFFVYCLSLSLLFACSRACIVYTISRESLTRPWLCQSRRKKKKGKRGRAGLAWCGRRRRWNRHRRVPLDM